MITSLLFVLVSCPSAVPAPLTARVLVAPDDSVLNAKIAAAGSDVAKLLELAASYAIGPEAEAAAKVYRKVLELDANNEVAHKALRHEFYDQKWFASLAELAKYKRDEAAKMKSKGLARFKDQWVPEGDVPFLNLGWTKDPGGAWINPVEAARAKQIAEWQTAGYQFRADDNSWVAPADTEKWSALQWKCGDEWLDMAKANEYHAQIGRWWQLAGEHFTVWTTCEWEGGNLARWNADQTHADLVRLFGVELAKKPHFIVLNSLAQYNEAAGGQPPPIPESEGISSLHGAYFADAYFDVTTTPPQFTGAGVSYWDRKDAKVAVWGPYWVRWAAAQSYIDAIDPSWAALGEKVASGARGDPTSSAAAFWSEKKIPRWLRFGAASYVERFMKNPEAAAGANPWDMREFAVGELKKAGGVRKLDDIFAFALSINDIDGSSRLYHEAGLVVAFLLDGAEGNTELLEKHQAFKTALKSGSKADATAAADALQKTLIKHEQDLRKFAGL